MPRANYRDSPSEPAPKGLKAWLDDRPQLPYLIPFLAFVAVMFPTAFGKVGPIDFPALWHRYFPYLYTLKTLIAAVLLIAFWKHYTPIRWTHIPLGVLVGLIGTPLWILIEYACQKIGLSHALNLHDFAAYYNPDHELHSTAARWLYLSIRVAGPTLVVPFMEELFFRDFLMRAMIRGARFQDVPIGTFTWFSFLGMSVLFGINHAAQWPEGIAYGILMGLLLIRTKSLGACITAHGVTNLTLYLYVIFTGDWQFM